ncbi:MAG: FAD-binding protein, partial [Chloroflexi bacterium]|nr:FAD-binding protein [Chloroflexota bacterium]
IDDSPDLFYADVMRKTRGLADPTVARALVDVAPHLVGWLADACGVPLELPTDFNYPGHSRQRCHSVAERAGASLHRYLLDAVAAQGERITLATPLRVVDVGADQAVHEATLERPDRSRERVSTAAVVLACGGFGANRHMVHEFMPEIENALYFGSDACLGDAVTVGQRLGADLGYLDAYQGHGSVATPYGILCTWITITHGGFLLNANGQRFGDESVGYSEFGRIVAAQPGGVAWMVSDRRIDAALRAFADYQAILDNDAIRWAASVDELATLIGAPVDELRTSLVAVEHAARGEAADPFGRTDWEAPLEPPYGVVKVEGALFHTQGGLLVNGDAAVLRHGQPIQGLCLGERQSARDHQAEGGQGQRVRIDHRHG